MATIQEKLAESLEVLKAYQEAHGDNLVIQGADTLGLTTSCSCHLELHFWT